MQISRNITRNGYKEMNNFKKDIQLVFNNCIEFNGDKAEMTDFVSFARKMLEDVDANHQNACANLDIDFLTGGDYVWEKGAGGKKVYKMGGEGGGGDVGAGGDMYRQNFTNGGGDRANRILKRGGGEVEEVEEVEEETTVKMAPVRSARGGQRKSKRVIEDDSEEEELDMDSPSPKKKPRTGSKAKAKSKSRVKSRAKLPSSSSRSSRRTSARTTPTRGGGSRWGGVKPVIRYKDLDNSEQDSEFDSSSEGEFDEDDDEDEDGLGFAEDDSE